MAAVLALALIAIAIAVPSMTGQPTEEDRPRAVGLPGSVALALIAAGVSAVNAQESDDAPPSVSARQDDNETTTPSIIGPPDSDDVTGQSPTTPGPPRSLTATVLGQTSIRADWSAPLNDGGRPIVKYQFSYGPVG